MPKGYFLEADLCLLRLATFLEENKDEAEIMKHTAEKTGKPNLKFESSIQFFLALLS